MNSQKESSDGFVNFKIIDYLQKANFSSNSEKEAIIQKVSLI